MGSSCSHDDMTDSGDGRRTAPREANNQEGLKATRPPRLSRNESHTRAKPGGVTRRKVFTTSSMRGEERSMPRKISKTEPDRLLIRQALQEGTVLSALSVYELDEVIDFMQVVTFTAGQTCDLSGALCVVVEGTVSINPEITENSITASSADSYAAGQVFGQVGLFHDKAPEMAVEGGGLLAHAEAPARVCKLAGSTYRATMEFSRQAQIKSNMKLLASIPIFEKMSVVERVKICDASRVVTYRVHDKIITEGEEGKTFYILRSGGAKVFRVSVIAFSIR